MKTISTEEFPLYAVRVPVDGTLTFKAGDRLVFFERAVLVVDDEHFCGQLDAGDDRGLLPMKIKKGGRPKGSKTRKPAAAAAPRARKVSALRVDQMAEAKKRIQDGSTIAAAAKSIGVPYGTVYAWAKTNGWETTA